MTNSLPIWPEMMSCNEPILFNLKRNGLSVRSHFTDHLFHHIHGFSLFDIDNMGIYFHPAVRSQINDIKLDLDDDRNQILKIIGVDIV